MSRTPLTTRLGQLAATGEWNMRRDELLAADIQRGPHSFVFDLGCGSSPVLRHLTPERYVGLDLRAANVAEAERQYARPGYEWVAADFLESPLDRWRGADVVTASAVFHHLTDEQVVALVERVADQVQPARMVFTEGVTTGPLRGMVTRLDEGEPSRPREALYELFRPRFEPVDTWSYAVPFRTFRYWGFELTPNSRSG